MQTITQYMLTDQMEYQGIPVLNCQIRYPQFSSTCGQDSSWQVNEFYRSMAEEKGAYCRSSLYPEALGNIPYMNMNLSDLNTTPPVAEIPKNSLCLP